MSRGNFSDECQHRSCFISIFKLNQYMPVFSICQDFTFLHIAIWKEFLYSPIVSHSVFLLFMALSYSRQAPSSLIWKDWTLMDSVLVNGLWGMEYISLTVLPSWYASIPCATNRLLNFGSSIWVTHTFYDFPFVIFRKIVSYYVALWQRSANKIVGTFFVMIES